MEEEWCGGAAVVCEMADSAARLFKAGPRVGRDAIDGGAEAQPPPASPAAPWKDETSPLMAAALTYAAQTRKR